MEKRIKTLYIITIIAIFAFLGMQGYWLYGRYEFSLTEYERSLAERIEKCVDEYNEIRETYPDSRPESLRNKENCNAISVPTFSLQQTYGDSVKTTRKAKIYTYLFSAHELLGLKPGTPLTDEQKTKAAQLAQEQTKAPADSAVFDASGARDENEAWNATRNVSTERKCRFTVAGLDSVMKKNEIYAEATLIGADSMVWDTTSEFNISILKPSVSLTIPYSQLQGLTVNVYSRINPFDILPGMWQTLIMTLFVSCLLIVCLIYQFSTVIKLSRLDRMRNSFVTTMIHELKRPLSTLKMCVSGLDNKRMVDDADTRKELLSETRNALDNLSAYFSKLRDITFNNVEQIPLNIQNVRLPDLFGNVVSATTFPADKTITVRNEIDEETEVPADRSHLYNILVNLMENAIKYSGPSVEIKAYALKHDGNVELHVCDTGNGISSTDLKHIFKRFYRGKASKGEQPGMGLGLAYVKLLVEAHGGRISVESTEGEGSCFTIIFPQ